MRFCAADLFFDAADAADEILREVYKVDVFKALDPLKTKDFEKIVQGLGRALAGKVIPVEDAALKKAFQKLDVKWTEMTAEARSKVVQEAQKFLGAPFAQAVLPKIQQELSFFTTDFVAKVKKNTVQTHDLAISPNLSATDERIAKFAQASQGHFVRDELGQRHDAFGAQARDIVAHGLERGLGSAAISEELADKLAAAKRSPGYWTMIAMVFANRARTSVQLFSYGEAGIEFYTWESVLDEATSMQCRFMHGRRFEVAGAIKNIRGVEEADDPEAVKQINPFMNLSGDALYYKGADGSRVPVATVTENTVGQKDKVGAFAPGALSTSALAGAGLHMPPIHGHCRSTVIPDAGAPTGGKPTPAAPVPGAPVPQPKPHGEGAEAKAKALAALDGASSGGMTNLEEVFVQGGVPSPLYAKLGPPDFLDAHFAAVKASKKPKLDELIPTDLSSDESKIADLIKSPKKLDAAAKPVVVKYKGDLFIHKGHEVLAAQKLLGQKLAYADFVDLDKHPVPPAPAAPPPHAIVPKPPRPPPAAPPPLAPALAPTKLPPSADIILGTKVGSAQGSNDGGFYVGKDGVKRYVKFYSDASQAPGEHLANTIYRDLGHGAAESAIFQHNGKTAYASVILDGFETLQAKGLTQERAELVMEGFVADVLTGNWDAVGTGLDNVGFDSSGKLLRIDNGGTFLMRAKNGRKADGVLNTISEWEAFFDPSINPYYAKVAKAAGVEKAEDLKPIILKQVAKIAELRDAHGGWAGYVEKHAAALPAGDKHKIVTMLEKRTTLLEAKVADLKKPSPPKPKALPKGAPITASYGKVVKPPPPDHDNLAVTKFEDLPTRKLPDTSIKVPPTGEQDDVYIKRARAAMAAINKEDSEAHRGIVTFTGHDYGDIRKRIAKAQSSGDTTSYHGKIAVAIERAFTEQKKHAVKGQTFRGIKNLPRAVIDQFMVQDTIDMKGIASATRSVEVAVERFMGGIHGDTPRCLFVIHQKTGLPIETVSQFGSELEILTSGKTQYRVLSRHRAEENAKAILIMEVEEIDR